LKVSKKANWLAETSGNPTRKKSGGKSGSPKNKSSSEEEKKKQKTLKGGKNI